MLGSGHQWQSRVNADSARDEVARVVEEGRCDLAMSTGEVCLADQDGLIFLFDEDLNGDHRARLFVRFAARRRPISLFRG